MAAARAETFLVGVVFAVRDTAVLVADFFSLLARCDNIVTCAVLRWGTVVFTAVRDAVALGFFSDIVMVVVFSRGFVVFFVREAASALNMQTAEIRIKDRIFFISE